MSVAYSPFVYWGQLKEFVSLNIDLRDARAPDIHLTEDSLSFKAFGRGSQGDHLYEFHIDFYLPVVRKDSQFKVTDHSIQLRVKKHGGVAEIWPRLTRESQKYPWLKIDFDKFASVDDDSDGQDSDDYNKEAAADFYSRMSENYNKIQSPGPGAKSIYLFIYYLLQLLTTTAVFVTLSYRYFRYGFASAETTVGYCGRIMLGCTAASVLELLHSYLSWTSANTKVVFFNVVRRNFELVLILTESTRLIHTPIVFFAISNWCFLDIIKYLHSIQTVTHKHTDMLLWLYHTLWMPLYPLSILLSGILIMVAIPTYEQSGTLSLELPNAYNFSLSFPLFLKAYVAVLLPLGTYCELNQRHKERRVYVDKRTRAKISKTKDKAKKKE